MIYGYVCGLLVLACWSVGSVVDLARSCDVGWFEFGVNKCYLLKYGMFVGSICCRFVVDLWSIICTLCALCALYGASNLHILGIYSVDSRATVISSSSRNIWVAQCPVKFPYSELKSNIHCAKRTSHTQGARCASHTSGAHCALTAYVTYTY